MRINKSKLKVSKPVHTPDSLAGEGNLLNAKQKKILTKQVQKQLGELKKLRADVTQFRDELLQYIDAASENASVFSIPENPKTDEILDTLESKHLKEIKPSTFLQNAFLVQTQATSASGEERDVETEAQKFIEHGKLFSKHYEKEPSEDVNKRFSYSVATLYAASNILISQVHRTESAIESAIKNQDDNNFFIANQQMEPLQIVIKTFEDQVDKSRIVDTAPKSKLEHLKARLTEIKHFFQKTFNKKQYEADKSQAYIDKTKLLKQKLETLKEDAAPTAEPDSRQSTRPN